jgi:plastocyanin
LQRKLSRRARLRALTLAVPTVALSFLALGTGLAGADTGASASANTDVIKIELTKHQLKFVAPESVTVGDQLEIVNTTNPKEVGPHTFSLVTKGSVPKTKSQRQSCFTPKHICMAISQWHGFNPKTEQISKDPAEAGPAGWSTPGSATKKGDSWFTEKKGDSISQEVTASAPQTLYFICAIHPWMHGKVKVLPAPTA